MTLYYFEKCNKCIIIIVALKKWKKENEWINRYEWKIANDMKGRECLND